MLQLRRSAARDLMLALFALVLLLLVPAVTYPDSTVRRFLFGAVLLLLFICIFVVWDKLAESRAEVQRLRDALAAHVAITQARKVDATVDTQLAKAREWQR